MLQASQDFDIFSIPYFSPLQANEYGIMTTFNANTPIDYVDFSLGKLLGLSSPSQNLNQFSSAPQTQQPQETLDSLRDRLTKVRDEAQAKLDEIAGGATKKCPQGEYAYKDIFGIERCGKQLISDGQGTMGNKQAPPGMETFRTWINALPAGSGVFVIAIAIVILLLLFARR